MLRIFFDQSSEVYDRIEELWEDRLVQKKISSFFVLLFLLSLTFIHLNYMGILPEPFAAATSVNHLFAIYLVFNLLLLKEVLDMIFMIPRSVSTAQLKQLKVLSLVLMRESFKHITEFGSSISWPGSNDPVLHVIASALAALAVFVVILFYNRLQKVPVLDESQETYCFIAEKKTVALFMLLAFVVVGLGDIAGVFQDTGFVLSIHIFFTIFVFSDILIVLISLRYSSLYITIFRNSGFAIATVLIRLSIAAPVYYQEAISIVAALFAYGVAYFYRLTVLDIDRDKISKRIK